MWPAWHLIASTSHTPKFLPFVCKHYIFSQGHIGEGQWEGRERRGDLLMHWPLQKEPCSPQEQSSMNNPIFLSAELGGCTQSSNSSLWLGSHQLRDVPGVSWPRKFWEHPWIANGVTQRPQGLRSWRAPKKILLWGSGTATTNNNTVLPAPGEPGALKRAGEAKRKRAQSAHSKAVEYKIQEKQVILN